MSHGLESQINIQIESKPLMLSNPTSCFKNIANRPLWYMHFDVNLYSCVFQASPAVKLLPPLN